MARQTKKKVKTLRKIIGIVLFSALIFTNISVSLTGETEISQGNLSIFGIEIKLQDNTYAKRRRAGTCGEICYIVPNRVYTYIVGYGYCDGRMG